MKLLINDTDGFQKVIEVHETGSYFDQSRVLWNEKTDGPLPAGTESKLGGLTKVGGSLIYDQTAFDNHKNLKKQKKDDEDAVKNKFDSALIAIKNADITKSLNSQELEALVKNIITVIRHT